MTGLCRPAKKPVRSGWHWRRKCGGLRLAAAVAIAVLVLKAPQTAAAGAAEGLRLCAASVIPALFPFMVLSPGLEYALRHLILRLCRGRTTPRTASLLSAFAVGMTAGFPVGAVTLLSLREQGMISDADAALFLGAVSASSPAFLTGYFGQALWDSTAYGWMLWGLQLFLNAVLFGLLLHRTAHDGVPGAAVRANADAGIPPLTASLRHASERMLSLCGTVVFFTVLRAYVCGMTGGVAAVVLCGMLELTGGLRECAAACAAGVLSPRQALLLSGGFTGFGGICAAMQIAAEGSRAGIGLRRYWMQKLVLGVLCALGMGVLSGI